MEVVCCDWSRARNGWREVNGVGCRGRREGRWRQPTAAFRENARLCGCVSMRPSANEYFIGEEFHLRQSSRVRDTAVGRELVANVILFATHTVIRPPTPPTEKRMQFRLESPSVSRSSPPPLAHSLTALCSSLAALNLSWTIGRHPKHLVVDRMGQRVT
jgi:hypothetical protein